MITEGNLATAQIAQLFGSELLKVQKNAQTDSGSTPEIVRLDPKQFLYNQNQTVNRRRAEEQRIIEMLQKEAEAAYPVAEPQLPPAPETALPVVSPPIQPERPPVVHHNVSLPPQPIQNETWSSIANSLERIANSLERVDISVKKKRIKRSSK